MALRFKMVVYNRVQYYWYEAGIGSYFTSLSEAVVPTPLGAFNLRDMIYVPYLSEFNTMTKREQMRVIMVCLGILVFF